MTKQEMFNKVAAWLTRPGFTQSKKDNGFCAYRGVDGNKCAIGILIPDCKYSPNLEGKSAYEECISVAAGIPEGGQGLAFDLQVIHDSVRLHTNMVQEINFVALEHGLEGVSI